jgi:hypothetical protein
MSSPNLVLRRLIVKGEIGCDLTFNYGLNVVKSVADAADPKSTNKCGKTSLIELILHGFGRRQQSRAKWYFAPIATQIDTLWMEIEAKERILTVQRSLRELSANIRVHDGPYAPGMDADPGEQVSVEGMSDFMLAVLGIPRVSVKQSDGTAFNLTFPTLMRSFVLHQEDSFGQILDKMIPEQRRTDVIGFVTRITPIERFTIEEQLGSLQREIIDLENRTKTIEAFLLDHGVISPTEIQSKFDQAGLALQQAELDRRALQDQIRESAVTQVMGGRIDELQRKLMELKQQIAINTNKLAGLKEEESRLGDLLNSLRSDEARARRLQASHTILSTIEFDMCPRCTLDITEEMKDRERHGRCSLCNRMLVRTSDSLPRSSARAEDIGGQVTETEAVLRDIRTDQRQVEIALSQIQSQHDAVAQQLDAESRSYVAPAVDALMSKARAVADFESLRAALEPVLLQARSLQEMRDRLLSLRSQQATLQENLRAAAKPDRNRLSALAEIFKTIIEKVQFPGVRDVEISSQSFMPLINGELYIHVGTALKGLATVCYHLALLEFARRFETFIPTFLVVDSPAVGDLNDANHDKLLQYFAQLEDATPLEVDWQVILTTRRSNQQLDSCVVETLSSPDRMLLRRSRRVS